MIVIGFPSELLQKEELAKTVLLYITAVTSASFAMDVICTNSPSSEFRE